VRKSECVRAWVQIRKPFGSKIGSKSFLHLITRIVDEFVFVHFVAPIWQPGLSTGFFPPHARQIAHIFFSLASLACLIDTKILKPS